jgi:addiction module HigA family antidote
MERDLAPIHPGEILLEDFLKPMEITQYRLAKSIGVSPQRIGEIVSGKRSITADTALRLAKFFGTDPESWMNLQAHYDLEIARDRLTSRLDAEVRVYSDALYAHQRAFESN